MLSKALQSVLRRYFGEFITGLENVELAFWTGKINIQNASFKHEKINELLRLHNIPLSIKLSFLGSLEIDVPWNKLTSAPVQIKLSNVMMVLRLEKVKAFADEDPLQHPKLLLIKNYLAYLMKKSQQARAEQESEAGFLKKLLIKILHNLNLEISNIHIRIENYNGTLIQSVNDEDEFVDCRQEADFGFSLGFCIQSIDAHTINANNEKQFVKVENERTQMRKRITLRQISLYWEEANVINLFELPQERKLDFLRDVISRQEHRLLTIDGQILMEKPKHPFDYFFSTSFRLLEVALNYEQLKQFIELYQQFANAKAKKKITKLKELQPAQQTALESDVKALLRRMEAKGWKAGTAEIQLLEAVEKKLLMRWTREEAIESIKRAKMRQAFESKNKKTWLGFLSKNTQTELSPAEIAIIEQEVDRLIQSIEEQGFGKAIGFYIHFSLLRLVMDHHRAKQQLLFAAEDIELEFQSKKGETKAGLEISDVSLVYEDVAKQAKVKIFESYQEQGKLKYFTLKVQDSKQSLKIDIAINPMRITHQIHFLSFLAELVKLRERERIRGEMGLLAPQLKAKSAKQEEGQVREGKTYEYRINMRRLEVLAELSESARLHAYIQAITIIPGERNSHHAQINSIGIAYLQESKDYSILQDLSIEVSLKDGLNHVSSSIPLLRLTLNEESLYYIIHCMRQQYAVLKIRSGEEESAAVEEEKVMEGEVSTIGVFKALTLYQCVLTAEHLIFYEKHNGKVSDRIAKKLLLRNLKISRIDTLSFKLESVFINEILTCKDNEEADRWIHQIDQCLFENSTRLQMFNMMEEESVDGPLIYIPYDSHINMHVSTLQVIYEKNTHEKILGLQLRKLGVSLKENNLQFERRVDLDEIKLSNLSLQNEKRQQYTLLLSNTYNYFEDLNDEEEEQHANIAVLIEGKKKTHPKYTGQVTINSKINKLFINYDAEFVFSILYRLVVGDRKEAPFSEEARNTRVFELLKEILEEENGIDERYVNAKEFEFNRSYVELEHYRTLYSCAVLFHVEVRCEEVEVQLVNGRNFHWIDRFNADSLFLSIDKSTDFLFIKGSANSITLADITGYPKTSSLPFTQQQPYPIIRPLAPRKHRHMVELAAGVFEPMSFINKERFKNYFAMQLQDAEVNYQQQPLLRFVDFLTNQIILFILEPFSLHKYDTPLRAPFHFPPTCYTEEELRKMLFESIYPTFTHLNFTANNLAVNFNSHPHDQAIAIHIPRATFLSNPHVNPQRIHTRLDELRRYDRAYPILHALLQRPDFDAKVSKSQWVTRYLIAAEGCRCEVVQNDFNYEMYFERSNNADKDVLLPFLRIQKDLLMQGRIKTMSLLAPRPVYNLINKCFLFNLAYDDQLDRLFNANHQYQHLNAPSKLIYRLFLNEVSVVVPDVHRTVIVVQNCEYKFLRLEDGRKEMEVNGKSLHVLGEQHDIITPLNLEQQRTRGLEYAITMKPSGEKRMTAFVREIDFHYHQEVLFPLFQYFLLEESCYPPQDVYTDIPLIVCEVYLLNSYIRLLQSAEHAYALKGDIKVIWSRYQQPHPYNYKHNKAFYPKDKPGSTYDVEFKGVSLRKYSKQAYLNLSAINSKQNNYYRSLSNSMVFTLSLTQLMRLHNDTTYNDLQGTYDITSLALKLSYKDYQEIIDSFQQQPQPQGQVQLQQPPAQPAYTPHSKHKASIGKLSLQVGLSDLPVPLVEVAMEKSQVDVQLMGKTRVLTSKVEAAVNYWNMMIGRWEPVVERSLIELTLKAGQYEKYLMTTSNRPLLLNFSVEALKVLTLVAKDVGEKGNLHVINREERAKGIQISPYVITNRTGFSVIIHSDFTLTAKLKNNEKMHLQHRSSELEENFSTVSYQIEGDSTLYDLNLNINQTLRPTITFNSNKYRLIVSPISTPVLKEIVISAPYLIHNRTSYPLLLTIGSRDYRVEPQGKVPIPFTEQLHDTKSLRLDFPHLNTSENFSFEFRDVLRSYEHYIIHADGCFNCLVSLETSNESVINVAPVVSLTNLLPLGVRLQVAVRRGGERVVLREEVEVNAEKVFYQFGSKDEVQVRLQLRGFNYSEFTTLQLNDREQTQLNTLIPLVDCRGLQATLSCKIIKKHKQKHIFVYAPSVIINDTDQSFYLFHDSHLLAGQRLKDIAESHSKYVLLGGVEEPTLGFLEEEPWQSKRFKTKELGEQLLGVSNNSQLHEFVVSTSMHCLSEQAQIFTSITKVAPRYILINQTTRPLAFQQHHTEQRFLLPVGERSEWHWHHIDAARKITVTALDQGELPEEWDDSAAFELESLQQTVLVVRPRGRGAARLLLRTEVLKESQQVYVTFREVARKEDSLIRLQNNLKLVNLEVQQEALMHVSPSWAQHRHFSVPALKESDFGWDYLEEEPRLLIAFHFIGPYRSRFDTDTLVLSLDALTRPITKDFHGENGEVLTVEVSMEIVGLQRTVIFQNRDQSQVSQCTDEELVQSMSGNKVGVSLAEIGVSVIGRREGHRTELVFMSVRKVDLIMTEKQQKRNFELRIKYLNIDNNLNHNTVYPVLFTPLKHQKTLDKSRPFFICLLQQNLANKQLNEINYLRLCIEPISFKIYDQMITHLYNFSSAIAPADEDKPLDVGALFRSNEEQKQWRVKAVGKEGGGGTFLREVEIGKIIVELSFSMRPTFKGNIILHTMLSLFGSAFTNVSESQMRLNRFLNRNLSLGELKGQLSGFYQREVMKEMFKIAGAINLFGNPYVFIKYLAEGTWEIVNQPSEGFIKGPIEGAIGIGRGGVYFLRNVVAATFNSFEAVSQSCSRGLAYITFDQKFITRRDKIQMQKSKHIVQGTKSALWALFTGFEVAVSGIVRHPREERRKSGGLGVMKGLALGLAGLVTKPLSGVFEAVSKFSEGVKQTALFFQDGPNVTRSRPPRVFISSQEYYGQYSVEESKAINLLEFHSTKHLDKTVLLVAVDQDIHDTTYTVVTSQYLVQLSKTNKKIIREVRLADIAEVEAQEQAGRRGVRIRYNDEEILVLSHKHRELYQCFKDVFAEIDQELLEEQEEQDYEQ